MDQPNPLLSSFTHLNEGNEKKESSQEKTSEKEKAPKQLGTLIVDDTEESPNDEGTKIHCNAKTCKHNVSNFCGRAEVQIIFNDGDAECDNFDPIN